MLPALRFGDNKPPAAAFVKDFDIPVLQVEAYYAVLNRIALVFRTGSENVLIVLLFKRLDVLFGEQAGIRDHHRMGKPVACGQTFDHGDQGVALEDVPLVYLVAYRVALCRHQQPQEYLRARMLPVLVEARYPKGVLLRCLKVERGHVVEGHFDTATHHLAGVAETDVLHLMLDPLRAIRPFCAQPVQKAVNPAHFVAHAEITPQVVHRAELAAGVEQPANHQMAEHLFLNLPISDPVVEPSENQFRPRHLNLGVADGR